MAFRDCIKDQENIKDPERIISVYIRSHLKTSDILFKKFGIDANQLLRLYKKKGLSYLKKVKDFHEEIRVDNLARSVLSSANKQQLLDELRKMNVVLNKEAAVVLTEE